MQEYNWLHNIDYSKWSSTKLGNLVLDIPDRTNNPSISKYQKFVGLEDFVSGELEIKKHSSTNTLVSSMKLFKSGDILFAKRNLYLKRVSIVKFDGICSGDAIVLRKNHEGITNEFLPIILNTEKFLDYAVSNSNGSTSTRVKFRDLEKFEFLLPPMDFQKRFADLIWSMEEEIEKTHTLETDLKAMKKGLLNNLFTEGGVLGDIVKKGDCKKVRFDEIARNCVSSERNPLNNGITRYVGLEHIKPETLPITEYGDIATDKVTFTKYFQKGQLLFGRRRAYLKKVGIADFDGICSSDILVFDPININKDLLPYVVQNDAFFAYAVNTSAGSLSPRTNWEDIKKYEFYLPQDKFQQEKIANIFSNFDKRIGELQLLRTDLQALKKGLINQIIK